VFDTTTIGKWLVVAGFVVIVIGGVFWLVGRFGLPLGRLPGDIRIEGKNFSFYFPITTSILVSILLTLAFNIIVRFWRK
jgi:hypothetical protein